MIFRQVVPQDLSQIAALHAYSWQQTYRGILNDAYLNDTVIVEKQNEWQQRLTGTADRQMWVLVAEQDLMLCGFSCLFFDHGPNSETYMDNLHVEPKFQATGLGKTLLKKSFKHAYDQRPDSGFYLWVFENNTRAINFYLKQGAELAAKETQDAPGGGEVKALKLVWTNLKLAHASMSSAEATQSTE